MVQSDAKEQAYDTSPSKLCILLNTGRQFQSAKNVK